jgi:hypothetical protein
MNDAFRAGLTFSPQRRHLPAPKTREPLTNPLIWGVSFITPIAEGNAKHAPSLQAKPQTRNCAENRPSNVPDPPP